MRYWCDFILHFLLSNSRHGTHSPFIYKIADKVIYKNSLIIHSAEQSKAERLIDALKSFFKTEIGEDALDFDMDNISFEKVLALHQEISVILLKNIYLSKEAKCKWILLQKSQNVLVTVDLFYFGILIQRKGQRKENFKLRFPFFKY